MLSKLRRFVDYQHPAFGFFGFLPPNAWSVLTVVSSALSGYFYYQGQPLPAVAFLALSGVTDLLDGGVARHFGRESRFGAIFDATMDRMGEGLIYTGLARHHTAAVLALVASFGVSYVRAKDERVKVGIAERGDRLGILALATLASWTEAGIWAVFLLASVTVVMRLKEAHRLNG